jgi:hypothetical protein
MDLLRRVAATYNIPVEELQQQFLNKPTTLVPNKDNPIEIRRKSRPKHEAAVEERCFARIFNRGKGGRCTRKHQDGCEFCYQHAQHRRFGDIRNEPPRDLFPKRKQLLFI